MVKEGTVLKAEWMFGVVIFMASAFLFWVAGSFGGRATQMGPVFWPRLILGALMLLSLIVSVGTVKKVIQAKAWDETLMTMDRGTVRLFSALGIIVGYLFLLPAFGFMVTTPFFLIAFMLLLGEKSRGWIIGLSLGVTAVIVLLFTKAMYVPLPRGVWLFREFTLLFY
jgi:hypothetical protein